MRDEIQKRPVLLPHRCNRHRILLHCIREIEAVLPNSKEETVSIYKKAVSDTLRPNGRFPSLPRPALLFSEECRNETDARFSGAFFSVPIGEVNMISITAGDCIFLK